MPPGREGQLGAETYRQIAALIRSSGEIDPAVLAAAGFGPAAAPDRYDPDTGAELWRTSTIAQPGDPNNSSWGDIPPHLRGGADMWIPGAYDAALDLFYIGTAQAKPWVAASRGMSTTHDALYTNSTLALDPRTGQVARSSSRSSRPA